MPTVKELIDLYADVTGEPRTRVNQLARRLIDDGLMPKSRGSEIKQVDSASALNLLFAVAFADRVADAPAIARQIAGLRLMDDQNEDIITGLYEIFAIPPDSTLGEVSVVLLDPRVKAKCQIELVRGADEVFQATISITLAPEKAHEKFSFLKEFSNPRHKTAVVFDVIFSNGDIDRFFYRVYQIGFDGFSSLRTILPRSKLRMSEPTSEGSDG